MKTLFFAFAVYLAIPVIEVPFFGLSVSALLFCFLAFELLLGRSRAAWRPPARWIMLAGLFWLGCFFSLAGNVFGGSLAKVEPAEALLLIRFGYWALVFVVTAAVMARQPWGGELAGWLAAGAVALAAMRLFEAAAFGYWGGGNPRFLSQNDYGLGFSAFSPFVIWAVAETKGKRRALACLGLVVLLFAVAGNGSRSSWVGVAAGVGVYGILAAASGRLRIRLATPALAAAIIAGLVVWLAPVALLSPLVERWRSFERLDRDKPFQTRLLMVEKGRMLFESSPVFGVGLGRFTKAEAPLELPRVLAWRPVSYYNRITPHNAYVKTLAETGLSGTAPLALLLGTLTLTGLPAAVSEARRGETWAPASYAAFISLSLHLWTLSGLTGALPWFLYGLTAAVVDRGRPHARRRSRPFYRFRELRHAAGTV